MALSTVDFKDFIRAGVGMSAPAARLATAINAIITAIGSVPNWGAGVADIAALKAVAAADRADKQSRVVEDNGLGSESIYVFDAESAQEGDDVNVVTPTAGTGRWLLAYQGNASTWQVQNDTGAPIAKGSAVQIVGWSSAKSKFRIALADSTSVTKQVHGITTAAIGIGAGGAISAGFRLASSGLNTAAAAIGDAVYYTAAGALTLTAPVTPNAVQVIGRVRTLAASGTVQVEIEPVQPANQLAANAQTDATTAIADAAAAQADADAALTGLLYAQVVIPNGSTTYNAAAPAGWTDGKPVRCQIGNATTNPVTVMSAGIGAGNLVIALGGCNGGVTGDPGASGATINVWCDNR